VRDEADSGVRRWAESALRAARLRTSSHYDRTRVGPDAERGTIAGTLALLFGSGAVLLLFTLLLPAAGPAGDRDEIALAVIAAVAIVVAAGLLIRFDRTPMWFLAIAPALGSLLAGA
jgi:hypothetical protein